MNLPREVQFRTYRIKPPLIKPSRIYEMGGWVINFAVGCTFGCKFCYVDSIQKKFGIARVGDIVLRDWGYYFAVPENIDEAIEQTRWERWKGKEVMLSSTHDAYLPQLYRWTRRILEKALESGVRINILTRSTLVQRDFDLLERYRNLVSVSVSIATLDNELSRLIEPRVVDARRRLEIIRKAKELGLVTGVHVAPIIPQNMVRQNLEHDLEQIAFELSLIKPEVISAESLHLRGQNLKYLEEVIGKINLSGFDSIAREIFSEKMKKYGLSFEWD